MSHPRDSCSWGFLSGLSGGQRAAQTPSGQLECYWAGGRKGQGGGVSLMPEWGRVVMGIIYSSIYRKSINSKYDLNSSKCS